MTGPAHSGDPLLRLFVERAIGVPDIVTTQPARDSGMTGREFVAGVRLMDLARVPKDRIPPPVTVTLVRIAVDLARRAEATLGAGGFDLIIGRVEERLPDWSDTPARLASQLIEASPNTWGAEIDRLVEAMAQALVRAIVDYAQANPVSRNWP